VVFRAKIVISALTATESHIIKSIAENYIRNSLLSEHGTRRNESRSKKRGKVIHWALK